MDKLSFTRFGFASADEEGPFTAIYVFSYFPNANSTNEAVVYTAPLPSGIFDDFSKGMDCTLVDKNGGTIRCAVKDKAGYSIKHFDLDKLADCPVADRYCFQVNSTIVTYSSPIDLSLNSISISPKYILGNYNKKNGTSVLDDKVILIFKHGEPSSYYSLEPGKYNLIARKSFWSSFFVGDPAIFYTFDSKNMNLSRYLVDEAILKSKLLKPARTSPAS